MTRLRVLIPMKRIAASKSRLAGSIRDDRREVLAIAMFASVVRAASSSTAVDEVTVASADGFIRWASGLLGAIPIKDRGTGLNGAVRDALEQAAADGVALLYLAADLPLVSTGEVDELARAGDSRHFVIAADRWRQGTNALLVPPGKPFEPSFGEGSFEVHLAAIKREEARVRTLTSEGLGLDIDTSADLGQLLLRRPGWWEYAEQVSRWLHSELRHRAVEA
jgi:2-phospho-L-lactate guanylyltransferase